MNMKMFFPPKNLSQIVCHPFQMMSNINRYTINIKDIRNIFKKKATWDEPVGKAQL
jgi:hypothetical protein